MTAGPRPRNTLGDIRAPHERLSATQYHVAHGICRGENNSAIGRFLSIHRTTVRKYEARILLAMGLSTRDQIKTYAAARGVFGMKKVKIIVKSDAVRRHKSV